MKQGTKILVTGGAGSCGRFLTSWLLTQNCSVRVLDREIAPLQSLKSPGLMLIPGGVEDREAVRSAVEGVDVILHLAWSFSEVPLEVLEQDLRGHLYLLEEAASRQVKHFVYTSTAVVYGKPQRFPIDEAHPLRVEEARKPLYGIAKAAAEKLCLMYGAAKAVPATVVRFWWAYGDDIGGKHLREMLKTAAAGEPLLVPADAGGSFLHMGDLAQGIDRIALNLKAFGRTFNLSTVYVTWKEVAEMVRDVTGSRSEIRCLPKEEWTGSAFLADPWELSDAAARETLGYLPMEAPRAKAALKGAIAACWEVMSRK